MSGVAGGRFDFDDGGTYCGGWEEGKAHGHGVCTGPKGQGEYSGAWNNGYEESGVYTWPSGNQYEGGWLQGKRHGLGVETKGRWIYRGEWTQGFKGRYGVRQSVNSGAKYEGTWTTGLQDGYGVETYADGGQSIDSVGKDQGAQGSTYQGQWLRGTRHGYGVRQSVPYGLAAHYRPKALRASLTSLRSEAEDDHIVKERDKRLDESRGGFVLKAKSDDESSAPRKLSIFAKQGRSSLKRTLMSGLKLKKQKSTGDINDSPRRPTGSVRSTVSNISHMSMDSAQSSMTNASRYTDSNLSFVSQDDITDVSVTETYMGDWKNDKRSGFGISERSDGLEYKGEWYNNKKYGYGCTTFKDGSKEEGKYKNNVLISSGKRNKLFLIRSSKMRERVDSAVANAERAAQMAMQKADIAISRMANARAKAEEADIAARDARIASDLARIKAKEFAPEFKQPGSEILKKKGDSVSNAPDYIGTKPIPVANHTQNANRSKQNYYQPPSPSPDKVNARGGHGLINKKDSTLPGGSKTNPTSNKNIESDNPYGHYASDSPKDSPLVTKKQNYSYEKPDNLNDLINSGMLNDHFDQYSAKHREDSGLSLGRESEYDYGGPPHNEPPTPDSVTDTDEIGSYRPNRRKTLPSLQSVNAPKPPEPRVVATVQRTVSAKVPNTASPPPRAYNRENGVRKRVAAEVHGLPTQDSNPHSGMGAKRGSLPDVTQCGQLKQNVASRETMSRLSHQRRQEMIREREEAEKRRKWDVVIRFSDVKDWCQQRQLLMFVIAVNVSLATVFFNLISQQ